MILYETVEVVAWLRLSQAFRLLFQIRGRLPVPPPSTTLANNIPKENQLEKETSAGVKTPTEDQDER